MHLIIDGDPIIYRAGFAAERNEYHLVFENDDSDMYEVHCAPSGGKTAGAQMRDVVNQAELEGYSLIDKQHVVIPEPLENALETVRTQLRSIEKECREYYGIERFSKTTLLLSGPGNYRESIATVFPYKGNRDPDHKPYWYQQIRNYLTGEWGARVVTGREADDECSILAWEHISAGDSDSFIVATIDKDLDQIPGNHYNYMKQVFYAQPLADAYRFFVEQSISGDATDGIPGATGTGNVGASKLAARMGDALAPNDNYTLASPVWNAIVRHYADSKKKKGCPYVDRDPATVALETARLVFLQHYPGQLWCPQLPHDLLPEFKDDE